MKKVFNIIFISLILATILSTMSFAGSSFDTFPGGSTRDPNTAKPGAWAYRPVTGTRYVFRVNGEDIGGDESQNYYINHVRNTTVNSGGLTYYNPRESEEKKGAANNRNWEMVYVGTNTNNTVCFKGNDSKYYFFDEPSSSLTGYKGKYRHIIIWARRNDGGKLYIDENSNMGLDKEDVQKLVWSLEQRIANLKEQGKDVSLAEKQVKAIKNGTANFEIRAEVLMAMRLPNNCGSGTIKRKDVYAEYNAGFCAYYTYREAWWIQSKIQNYTYGPLRDFFKPAAKMLREVDDGTKEGGTKHDYIKEYESEATALKASVSAIGSKWWGYCESYYYGWDYIEFENPYENLTTKITINYKDEKTGDFIKIDGLDNPEYSTQPGTFTKKDLDSKGYTYTGLEINEPEPSDKNPNATSVTISDDKKEHVITFWYKPEEVTRIKVTHKSESGKLLSETNKILKKGDPKETYIERSKDFGPGYEYTGVEEFQPEKKEKTLKKEPIEIGFSGDKTFEITFWYKMKTEVKIYGKCSANNQIIYQSDVMEEIVPLDKTYFEKSYQNKYNTEYYELTECEIQKDTLFALPKGTGETTSKKEEARLVVDETKDAPQQITIIFYYNSKFKVEVKHVYVDPMGKNPDKQIGESKVISITPFVEKDLDSKHVNDSNGTHCINLKYEGEDITPVGFKQYSQDMYKLKLTPGERNYTVIFYYTSQTINVRHEKENGDLIEEKEKILNPSEEENPLEDYTFKESKLNDDLPTKDTPIKVPVKEGVPSQELVFIYKDPELIFGPEDPNENPDQKSYTEKVNTYKTGIIPNDLKNQLIGQDATKYYWVLNDNGEITVRLAIGRMDGGKHSFTGTIEIPFDVYIDKEYKNAQTPINITFTENKTDSDDDYIIFEAKIKNIYVPVWVEEKEYEITGKVNYVYTSADGKAANPINSTATAEVTVVGAVYDFTVTNLDGSDTTGDSMWKKSLFPTVKQVEEGYKATATAIGQGTQQPSKYYQAIKRGTRFYFSVNTLGAANNQIEIVPSFYYVSANGQSLEKVTMKSNYMNSTRSINLNDTNRVTTEFSKERTMKNTLDTGATSKAGTVFEVGTYRKLTLNRNVNTPYLGIVNDVKAKFAGKELTAILQGTAKTDKDLYQVANHWYADYSVPNDATFYKADGTQVDENGCLVVYFSIITRKNDKSEYLAYNLESPFVQSDEVSEWNYERTEKLTKKAEYRLVLPKASVNNASKNIATDNIWIKGENKAGHTAVIIYSLKQNVSTRQNVTSAGTH